MEKLFEGETELRFNLPQGQEIRIKVDTKNRSVVVRGAKTVDVFFPIYTRRETFRGPDGELMVRARQDHYGEDVVAELHRRNGPWWPPAYCPMLKSWVARDEIITRGSNKVIGAEIRVEAGFTNREVQGLGSMPLTE